jgi:hypothetical protein
MAGVLYNNNPATSSEPGFGLSAKAYSLQYLKGLYARPGAWKHMLNTTADAGFGESVSLAELPSITAVDVTQSTGAFSYDNTSILQRSIVMDKIKAVPHSIPEYMILQSKYDVKSIVAENAAKSVNDSIDHEFAKLIASLSTNSAGSANADLTETYVFNAMQKLADNKVPLDNPADLVWILPSSQFSAVHLLKGYTAYRIWSGATDAEGGNDVKANILTLLGVDVHFRVDSELTVTSGKIGGLFHRDSVGVAVQRAPSMRQPMPIPGTINTELLTYAIFGISLLAEKRATKVLCK